MKVMLFPGTFDPFTRGHRDIARRASKLCDKLVIAVMENAAKTPLFSPEERVELIKLSLKNDDLDNVEVMAWKTVKGSDPDTEHVKFRTLPEVEVASCTYKGSYTLITDVYAAVVEWLNANGYESDGPMFNIYHVSPHETQNPDEFVTEVCYPVKKKT